jgi:hypothetical protein
VVERYSADKEGEELVEGDIEVERSRLKRQLRLLKYHSCGNTARE